jgi:hypothetical protein
MQLVVHPGYRWLNTALASLYALLSLAQIIQAVSGDARSFHFAAAAFLGFVAFAVHRVMAWVYLLVFLLNFVGLVGILKNLDVLGIYGLLGLALGVAMAWSAVTVRQNLVLPVDHQARP